MLEKEIQNVLLQALNHILPNEHKSVLDTLSIKVEAPRDPSHGDYATNIAMALAKPLRMAPRKIAEQLLIHLQEASFFERIDIADPGFINFRLSWKWLRQQLQKILPQGQQFGHHPPIDSHRYLLEFVSANPTGPLHFGHGRWAVLGDCLARLMRVAGYQVSTEFYVNDAGSQIENLGHSVEACYYQILLDKDVKFPARQQALLDAYNREREQAFQGKPEFYHGDYIGKLAQELFDTYGDGLSEKDAFFADFARNHILKQQQDELEAFGVHFDRWYSERELHDRQSLDEVLTHLKNQGMAYEKEGALWFKSSAYGNEKDKVLLKSDGSPTYFTADIAYHWDKLRRGFDRLLNIWGADHHGQVPHMKAAIQALGYPAESLEVILGQMVNVLRSGELVRMSKRTGNMITFAEVFEEVGKDATRYLLMQRSPDTTLDFDMTLAQKESSDNPVFYVQYAHARICSIFRTGQSITAFPIDEERILKADLQLLTREEERAVILKLLSYPEEVQFAAKVREPHRLTRYAQELATLFHQFYKQCRVLNEADEAMTLARLHLVRASQIVLRNLLTDIFGINAPEKM